MGSLKRGLTRCRERGELMETMENGGLEGRLLSFGRLDLGFEG